jgi:hypothetical protein
VVQIRFVRGGGGRKFPAPHPMRVGRGGFDIGPAQGYRAGYSAVGLGLTVLSWGQGGLKDSDEALPTQNTCRLGYMHVYI